MRPSMKASPEFRKQLAGYKTPKDVVVVTSINRAPSGKVDYAALRALARDRLGR